jgi:integrase
MKITDRRRGIATTRTAAITTAEEILPDLLEAKIKIATEGLIPHFAAKLRRLKSKQNIETICDYIIAINAETNPSIPHRQNQLQTLCYISEFFEDEEHYHQQGLPNKRIKSSSLSFPDMTRSDILAYLDSIRRPEESDPYHKWIGTYNLRRAYLVSFFKWLYYSAIASKNRPMPEVMTNISQIKRREQSTINAAELWTDADHSLFLKYCDKKRDRAYHMIARDSSCRPSEILGLRIRDLHFKMGANNKQYVEILVNGKTGTRNIPLYAAVPYVKDWLDDHPQKSNPNAFLISSFDRKNRRFGNRMKELSLNLIYRKYRTIFFSALLEDPKVISEDKDKGIDKETMESVHSTTQRINGKSNQTKGTHTPPARRLEPSI